MGQLAGCRELDEAKTTFQVHLSQFRDATASLEGQGEARGGWWVCDAPAGGPNPNPNPNGCVMRLQELIAELRRKHKEELEEHVRSHNVRYSEMLKQRLEAEDLLESTHKEACAGVRKRTTRANNREKPHGRRADADRFVIWCVTDDPPAKKNAHRTSPMVSSSRKTSGTTEP